MSDFNIPIIEPTIDYTKVPPIAQKRTIAFINHFLAHTVTYLNKFALYSEEKLFEFENKIQKVEAALEILEARLSSIPELQKNEQVPPDVIDDNNKVEESKPIEVDVQKVDEPDNNVPVESIESEAVKTETQSISSDPQYAKYFKMMHFGVPKQAVKLKMEQDGLDSSVLDDPNQLVTKPKPADDESAGS